MKTNQKLQQNKFFNRVVFSTITYKWNTPLEAFNELNKEFHFTCDPHHPPIVGNFTGNALSKDWYGRVFANVPYGRKTTKRHILRAWHELVQGHIELFVLLLPSRSGTSWFHFLVGVGAEFRIVRGRLKFGDKTTLGAPFDSIVAIVTRKTMENYFAKNKFIQCK